MEKTICYREPFPPTPLLWVFTKDGLLEKLSYPQAAADLTNGSVIDYDNATSGTHSKNRKIALFTTSVPAGCTPRDITLSEKTAEIRIGRESGSDLQIASEQVSKRHASFFHTPNGWAVIDHGSTNGVFLNHKRLTSPRYLNLFDVVQIADSFFVFLEDRIVYLGISEKEPVMPPAKDAGELCIQIIERSVTQHFKKLTLLQDINLSVSRGNLVLILGGSGAGKTTFLHAVMGYEKADGKILYKDTDIYEAYEQMKYEIGFVPQQDLLRGSDTVYDTLANAAEMKLPRSVDPQTRLQRIDDVLAELGLSRERDFLVSKLSGGQKKRLSIAVELIADPDLFFLDEPDSGIDDVMGRSLMESLRAIADKGKIVMVITHSPERAADLFDKVLVLAKSAEDNTGHLAFFGDVADAYAFFGVSSFREIVRKINRPDENGEGLADYYIEKYRNRSTL